MLYDTDNSMSYSIAKFLLNYESWLELLTFIVLTITLIYLIKYTKATQDISKVQAVPNIDAFMVYDQANKGTCFWFLNTSNIPAFVEINITLDNRIDDIKNIGPLLINPHHPLIDIFKKTMNREEFSSLTYSNNSKAKIRYIVSIARDDTELKYSFTRNYTFDTKENVWNEDTWNINDPYPPKTSCAKASSSVSNKPPKEGSFSLNTT